MSDVEVENKLNWDWDQGSIEVVAGGAMKWGEFVVEIGWADNYC